MLALIRLTTPKIQQGHPRLVSPAFGRSSIRARRSAASIANSLPAWGLPIVDKRKVAGIGGKSDVDVHLAQVHVPALGFTMYGLFSSVHLAAGGQVHSVLIGRTFLRDFVMTYEGPSGTVVLTHHSMFPGGRIFSTSVPLLPNLPAEGGTLNEGPPDPTTQ
jgi:hypothetical protein